MADRTYTGAGNRWGLTDDPVQTKSFAHAKRKESGSIDHLQPGIASQEVIMDKVWLYIGGIVVGAALLIYAAISFVGSVHPPEADLRAAYETTK